MCLINLFFKALEHAQLLTCLTVQCHTVFVAHLASDCITFYTNERWLLSGLTQVSIYLATTWKMAVINDHVLLGSTSVFPKVKHIWVIYWCSVKVESTSQRAEQQKSLHVWFSREQSSPGLGELKSRRLRFVKNSLSQQLMTSVNT